MASRRLLNDDDDDDGNRRLERGRNEGEKGIGLARPSSRKGKLGRVVRKKCDPKLQASACVRSRVAPISI